VWATHDGTGLHYERYFPNGFVETTWRVTDKALDPMDLATAPAGAGEPARVAVLVNEGTSNL
jgi:hypothetical protein